MQCDRRSAVERQEFMELKKRRMSKWIATCVCAFAFGFVLVYGMQGEEILKATPDHFDFGAIPEGEPAVATASVENMSSAPVTVTNIRTS